jgi:hypothetical protein
MPFVLDTPDNNPNALPNFGEPVQAIIKNISGLS